MKGLHNLHRAPGSQTRKTRIGRGAGSGIGTYSGRGVKGQRARAGGRSGIIARSMKQYLLRIPKVRGFKSGKRGFVAVNIGDLQQLFKDGDVVSPESLRVKGLLTGARAPIKVLSAGKLSKKLKVRAHAFSQKAQEMITKAGGTVEMLVAAPKVEEKVTKSENKAALPS